MGHRCNWELHNMLYELISVVYFILQMVMRKKVRHLEPILNRTPFIYFSSVRSPLTRSKLDSAAIFLLFRGLWEEPQRAVENNRV